MLRTVWFILRTENRFLSKIPVTIFPHHRKLMQSLLSQVQMRQHLILHSKQQTLPDLRVIISSQLQVKNRINKAQSLSTILSTH